MTNVWFTSDLHIGHAKVAEERAVLAGITTYMDGHPEKAAHEIRWHDRTLAQEWDSRVGKDDVVWVLGDISSGKAADQNAALRWVSARPGRKRLILGNHDGPHPMHRDAYKWWHYNDVFEYVSTSARIRLLREDGHLTALLSHFPYVGDHSATDRHAQWRLRDEGAVLIHGHVHSSMIRHRWVHPRQIHVGVDAWDLRPVALDEVSACIPSYEVSSWQT